ncbi:GGDEF domain-containing protein [Streptomyces sp. NP160]|nr:GGDEF domain-containing protein [Streptomyces sp. NP160]
MVWTTSLTMVVCGAYTATAALVRGGASPPGGAFWVAVAAVVAGALIALGRRWYRTWHYHLLQPCTGLAVALGLHLDGGGAASAADASLCVVLAALASFFFPWTTAGVHVLVNTALMVLALQSVPGVGPGDVVALVGSAVTAGLLVGTLSRLTTTAVLAAELDALTGLPNRRGTQRRLLEALPTPRAAGALSLAIVDLDHFKQVNDELGHAAGDDLLCRAATSWTALLPPAALLGRWGGDEFVLLAPLDPHRTAALVDGLRAALPPGRSCTAGVTGLAGADHLDAALGRADQALYAAKRAGRGRTRVWSPADAPGQPWLDSQPSMRSDSGSSGSSGPEAPSSGASSGSMPTAAI